MFRVVGAKMLLFQKASGVKFRRFLDFSLSCGDLAQPTELPTDSAMSQHALACRSLRNTGTDVIVEV
jgi:hypothetical protein